MRRCAAILLLTSTFLLGGRGCAPDDTGPDADDADADGYGIADGDCDDDDANVNPAAEERCDDIDNDCDGDVDEDDAVDAATWYADADGDGYGDASSTTAACTQPTSFVSDDTDCDDSDASIHPGATELADGIDNDCDGAPDVEDCGNGRDDDADGLVDCEDGDCSGDSRCSEEGQCLDFTDNDGDGTTDCDDDDCWSDCGDAPYRARVRAGNARFVRTMESVDWDINAYWGGVANGTSWESSNTAMATNVSGVLSVVPSTSWTGSAVATCRWSVANVNMRFTSYGSDDGMNGYDLSPATRSGFYVASGCGWSTSGFLPESPAPRGAEANLKFYWSHGGFWGLQYDWYQGKITASTRSTVRSTRYTAYPSTATMWETITSTTRSRSYHVQLTSGADYYPAGWIAYRRWGY